MVSRGQIDSLTEEAICPICLDSSTDPVILECGHNFCRSCMMQFWEREQRNSCPDRTLKVNRALANLSEKARKLNLNPTGKKNKLRCEKPEDELRLFYETDEKLLCVICRDAREHRDHHFLPIKEAVAVDRDRVKSALDSLTEKKCELEDMERQQKEKISGVREEAHQKRSVSEDDKSLSMTHGSLPVENFNHPFLLNTTLKEMSDTSKQVSVTLDVETAHPELELSEDRKSVRWTGTWRDLPDTGKRFTVWECVLGSEGFTSGRHYWEVEVEGNLYWCLGVAAESVERESHVGLRPKTGFWIITGVNHVISAPPSSESCLPAGPIPGRMGVYLSYESGTVSFYNAVTKSHLHTFTGNKFTEKLYPFFWTWHKNRWLRICSGPAPGL